MGDPLQPWEWAGVAERTMTGPGLATLAFVLAAVIAPEPPPTAALSIRMSGFRSDAGQVLVAVYRGPDGFPGAPGKAWTTAVATIAGGRARVDLAAPPGEYAFAIVHDENGNGAVDTNWLGIPKEGLGTSNNATGRFGPPKYRDARFTLPPEGLVQRITMVYL